MHQADLQPFSEDVPSSVFKVTKRDSDTAVLVFAHRDAERFYMEGTVAKTGYSGVFVRDPTNCWYNAPIPGLGEDLDEIQAMIVRGIQSTGATRVITLGMSMGGYGAILFGCRLGAEHAVALYPQTFLDPVFKYSPPVGVPLQAADLRPVVAAAPDTPILLVSPEHDLDDAFYAAWLSSLPSVDIIHAPGMQHAFLGHLKARGELDGFMRDLLAGTRPAWCNEHRVTNDELADEVITTVLALRRGHLEDAAAGFSRVVSIAPDWLIMWTEYALVLRSLRRLDEAADAVRQGLELKPSPRLWAEYSRVLQLQERYDEAAEAALEAIRLAPKWSDAYKEYGMSVLQLPDRAREAEIPLRVALSLHHGAWAVGHYNLGLCLEAVGRLDEARKEFAAALAIRSFPDGVRALERVQS